jgi:hypothetical protein
MELAISNKKLAAEWVMVTKQVVPAPKCPQTKMRNWKKKKKPNRNSCLRQSHALFELWHKRSC